MFSQFDPRSNLNFDLDSELVNGKTSLVSQELYASEPSCQRKSYITALTSIDLDHSTDRPFRARLCNCDP